MRKKYKREETKMQDKIRVALSDYGICFRTANMPHENEYGQYYKGTLPAGFSDLLFIGDGFIAFIEVKAPRGKPSPEQLHFLDTMRQKGHRGGVAYSIEDAIKIINNEEI